MRGSGSRVQVPGSRVQGGGVRGQGGQGVHAVSTREARVYTPDGVTNRRRKCFPEVLFGSTLGKSFPKVLPESRHSTPGVVIDRSFLKWINFLSGSRALSTARRPSSVPVHFGAS